MTILPIQSVDQTDQPEVGKEVCQLAVLKRSGWPTLSGWVVVPPGVPVWSINDRAHFEQKSKILKKEWLKIPAPIELMDLLKRHKQFLFRGTIFSGLEIWNVLLEHWFSQIQSQAHRYDSLDKLSLTAELLWQTDGEGRLVRAVYDPNHRDVRIESEEKLDPSLMQQIDRLVLKTDKKLLISHLYTFWIQGNNPYLTQLATSTEIIFTKNLHKAEEFKNQELPKTAKSVMKVVLELKDQAYLTHSVDGAMVSLEDLEQLVIIAQALGDQPVFCAMSNNTNPELEGSLGLLHHKLILEKNCRNLLVALKKEHHVNLNLVLPVSKSSQVTSQLRRQMTVLGVDRAANLRLVQTLALPENLLHLDKYLEQGFDGVLIDLDRIYQQLSGITELERPYYPLDWAMLNELLVPAFKKLHSSKVQILVRGKLALHAEILEFLVHSGVWGIVVPKIEADGLTEHLYWTEKKVVKKRTEPRIPL